MIISISGLDGAGKSTQIEKLAHRLKVDGVKTRYIWARGGYTPGFEKLKRALRFLFNKKLPPPGNSNFRDKGLRSPIITKIWLSIAIFDLILLWGLYIRICSFFKIIVICDRYIGDTLLDFRKNFPKSRFEKSILWRILKFVTPSPDYSFLFWIPVDISLQRSIDKGEPFPDSREVLEWRLGAYMDTSIFTLEDHIRVDGQAPVEVIHDMVYSKIRHSLN
jgi:dTMP kinase